MFRRSLGYAARVAGRATHASGGGSSNHAAALACATGLRGFTSFGASGAAASGSINWAAVGSLAAAGLGGSLGEDGRHDRLRRPSCGSLIVRAEEEGTGGGGSSAPVARSSAKRRRMVGRLAKQRAAVNQTLREHVQAWLGASSSTGGKQGPESQAAGASASAT
eukprot:364902-Chlamydomonas_euryale.AAC.5